MLSQLPEILVRQTMARTMPIAPKSIIVCEYPKSGGTWLSSLISNSTGIAFPRNKIPRFAPSILHCHYLKTWGMKNVVVMWRDPRDIVVSFYHHCYFENEHGNSVLVELMKRKRPFQDYEDIEGNLPVFIERLFEDPLKPNFSIADFVDVWSNQAGVTYTSYEALRAQPGQELVRILTSLGFSAEENTISEAVEQNSFERLTRRQPGDENKRSFLRSGTVGNWKKYFSDASCNAMKQHCQSLLEKLGYETGTTWTA